jgi:hypothetical protein
MLELVDSYRQRAEITARTGTVALTAHYLRDGEAAYLDSPGNRLHTGEYLADHEREDVQETRHAMGTGNGHGVEGATD